jgi:hypothetical protein
VWLESALDKKVVADSKRIDDNATEGINIGKKINETLVQGARCKVQDTRGKFY